MKKALSVFMAVLMLFTALSVGSFASSSNVDSPWFGEGGPASNNQVVISFKLNGGKLKQGQYVYNIDTGRQEWTEPDKITGTYVMVPRNSEEMIADSTIVLPLVTAPEGYQFNGWFCTKDGQTYGANAPYRISPDSVGGVLYFEAAYSPVTIEEDTFTKVIGILIKIFGAIIGLIMYAGDTEAGIELMEKILGGVIG